MHSSALTEAVFIHICCPQSDNFWSSSYFNQSAFFAYCFFMLPQRT